MTVVEVEEPSARSQLCETVLRDLPDWFGIESATAAYIRDVAELPTLGIGADASLSLKLHTARAAEVYVMGVRRLRHGQGLGTALLQAAEEYLRARGFEYLQVKTLGPSDPDEGYARTRAHFCHSAPWNRKCSASCGWAKTPKVPKAICYQLAVALR